MKKLVGIIIGILILTFVVGCSKASVKPNSNKTTKQSNTATNKDTNATTGQLTKEDTKNIDDSKLLGMSQEQSVAMEDLQITDDNSAQLDSILNSEDSMNDIPSSVNLSK